MHKVCKSGRCLDTPFQRTFRRRYHVFFCFRELNVRVHDILDELWPAIRNEYINTATFHDGKWLAIAMDSDVTMAGYQKTA